MNPFAALFLAASLSTLPADPPADAIWRFPREACCQSWVTWGREYQRRVGEAYFEIPAAAGQFNSMWWDYWNSVQMRTDAWEHLLKAWRAESDAERRRHLAALRRLLGDMQFECGFVPPPVDLRFVYVAD